MQNLYVVAASNSVAIALEVIIHWTQKPGSQNRPLWATSTLLWKQRDILEDCSTGMEMKYWNGLNRYKMFSWKRIPTQLLC